MVPSRDGIPSRVFRKCVLENFAMACGGVWRFVAPWSYPIRVVHSSIPSLPKLKRYTSVQKCECICDREKNVHIHQDL